MRRPFPVWKGALAAAVLCGARLAGADLYPMHDPSAPVIGALRDKLPPDMRDPAVRWFHLEPHQQQALLSLTPRDLAGFALLVMAQVPDAQDFVLSELPRQARSVQISLIGVILEDPKWRIRPTASADLEKIGDATADSDLALHYYEASRRLETARLRRDLVERIAAARGRGDQKLVDELEQNEDLWRRIEAEVMLPGFLNGPPPPFAVLPPGRLIRVAAMGDFGEGSFGQRQVAASIAKSAAEKPFDFGITLGDNFYPSGMKGLDDPRWRDWWEKLYGPLHIKFYASFGNHDLYTPDSPAAEIMYSQRSESWRMPGTYYTFTAGSVQFFALDTNDIDEAQKTWLEHALAVSQARWKVVYGHHPIYAAIDSYYTAYARERLWPIIRGKVDVYLSGHHHAMAQLKPEDGVHFWVAGGGGAHLHGVLPHEAHTEMVASTFGFAVLEADSAHLAVTLYDGDDHRLDGETLTK